MQNSAAASVSESAPLAVPQKPPAASRLRLSAGLVLFGVLVEAFSFHWNHPTTFVLFAALGASAIAAGILIYLYTSLVA
jgi:hypothetical protein